MRKIQQLTSTLTQNVSLFTASLWGPFVIQPNFEETHKKASLYSKKGKSFSQKLIDHNKRGTQVKACYDFPQEKLNFLYKSHKLIFSSKVFQAKECFVKLDADIVTLKKIFCFSSSCQKTRNFICSATTTVKLLQLWEQMNLY